MPLTRLLSASPSSIFIVVAQLPSHAAGPSRHHRTQAHHGPIEALCLVNIFGFMGLWVHEPMIGDGGNSGFMGFGLLGLWVFDFFFFLLGLVVIVDWG